MKYRVYFVLLLIIICILVTPLFVYASDDSVDGTDGAVERIYGDDRYATSYETAEALKEQLGVEKFDYIIIANGTNFADALSGSYLAAKKDAPILLTNNSKNNVATLQKYVNANIKKGGTIYLLGGEKAVADSVAEGLVNCTVERLAGADRYATNLAILEEAGVESDEILVCTGDNFADSLSASASERPILLVGKNGFTNAQINYLTEAKAKTIYVIGGEQAVSNSILKEAKEYASDVKRLEGATRYETSVRVAEEFFSNPSKAVVVYGQNFPDGLSGGPLAVSLGGPLILSKAGAEDSAVAYAEKAGITRGMVLGGPKLLSDSVVKKIFLSAIDREKFAIIYQLNKGENSPSNPDFYLEGKQVILEEPTRDNHVFKGWYLDKACTKRIAKIDTNTRGPLTLYAKWHLAALNINDTGMDDMIWSWWYYPQVISDETEGLKVFWGYATKDGYCGVAQYDEKTGNTVKTALKKANADDHNGLALTFLKDKRIMCVYAGGHNTDNEIHIRISDSPLDISSFSTDIVLESSGKTCYGQIIQSNSKYYLFYRINNNSWAYRSSVDGTVWSDEVVIVNASMQYYCKVVNTTDENLLRIIMYSNPAASAPEIRMGFLDTSNNSVYNGDGEEKIADSKNSYDVFKVLKEPESEKTQRLFDVAITEPDKPRFLYTSFTGKSKSDDSVYYLYDTGSTYKICKGGKPLWDPKYQLGATFVDENTIVAGRNHIGIDHIELYKYDGTKVTFSKTLDSQSETDIKRNARPIVDINGKAILWHNGYYNPKSYSDYDTDARLYLIKKD